MQRGQVGLRTYAAELRAGELDALAEQLVDLISTDVPAYLEAAGLTRSELLASCRSNLDRSLTELVEGPPPAEPGGTPQAETGRRRAAQQLPLEALLHSYRLGGRVLWHGLVRRAGARGDLQDARRLLDEAGAVWEMVDRHSSVVAAAYREEQARLLSRTRRRRDAVLVALLEGRGGDAEVARAAAAALDLPPRGRRCVVTAALDLRTPDPLPGAQAALSAAGYGSVWVAQACHEQGLVQLPAEAGTGDVVAVLAPLAAGPQYDGQAASQLVGFLGGATGVATGPGGAPFDVAGLVKTDAVAHDGVHHDHDPRVGMIGGSYGGQIQFAVAGIDPRVDALAPTYTWNDLQYSLGPNNTALTSGVRSQTPGVAKYQWDSLFFGLGVAQPVLHPVYPTDPSLCVSTRPEVCQADAEQDSQGFPSPASQAFYRSVSVSSYLDKIKIPVLLSQGQNDSLFDLQEAVATYSALKAQGNPVRMVWQSWGHSGGTPVPGELDPGDATYGSGHFLQSVQGKIWSDWFAHWLKDQNNDLGPAVRLSVPAPRSRRAARRSPTPVARPTPATRRPRRSARWSPPTTPRAPSAPGRRRPSPRRRTSPACRRST